MSVATGKNLDAIPRKVGSGRTPRTRGAALPTPPPPSVSSPQTQNYFLGCFLLKFALTVSAYLLAFGFTLQEVCQRSSRFAPADNATALTCLHILTAR